MAILTTIGCSSKPAPSAKEEDPLPEKESVTVSPSDSTARLLEIVEDDRFRLADRADAASLLGERPSEEVVDRLLKMLPGGHDALTLEILVALGKSGNPKALPMLERLQYSGRLRAAQEGVIEQIRKKAHR